ncbi:MAG: hypothetical protein RIS44_2560 [Pseudomonadota bacterium]|jgi:hypothetical protein
MAFEKVDPIDESQAVVCLEKCAAVGGYTAQEIASCGQAYRIKTTTGEGVFVLSKEGSTCWVAAAEGVAAEDLTATGLALIELIAKQAGCMFVAFKTRRAGLVRKVSKLGYSVDQIYLKKAIQ